MIRKRVSRLQRLEEKRSIKRSILYVVGGILLIGILAIYGIGALSRFAGFISQLGSANRPVDKSDVIPPRPPDLRSSYTATNSASIDLGGTSEAQATVYLTRNENAFGNILVDDSGDFVFRNVGLVEGQNVFAAVAFDAAGNQSQPSTPVEVFHSTTSPSLELTAPMEDSVFKGKDPRITVAGKTDAEVRILVNGRVFVVDASGLFDGRVSLTEGENVVQVEAVDRAGNRTLKEVRVEYRP